MHDLTRVALLGCAHIHTPGFVATMKRRADVSVSAVWDYQPERAAKYAAELEAPVKSLEAILADPAIEAVVICSETNRHEELVLPVAAAKKHLFVEKPLGMGARDAFMMAEAIEKAGVLFQTGYFMRGYAAHQFIKAQVAAGSFGIITRVRHSNCHSGALGGWFDTDYRWMADPAIAGCGAFGDLGTHVLDILLWIFGDVKEVTASIGTAIARYPNCDEFGEGMLNFSAGMVGTLAAGWVDINDPVTLLVSGTEGFAYLRHGELFFQSKHVEGADGKTPWTELPAGRPHAFEIFLDNVLGDNTHPLVTAREAAYRSAVMEALYQGSNEKRWVEVPGNANLPIGPR